jgi:predicted aspartyl protease
MTFVLAATPSYAENDQLNAIIKRADDLFYSGKTKEAFAAYQQAYQIDDKSALALYGIGHCYMTMNDPHTAIMFMNSAIANSSNYVNPYRERGVLYRQLKQYNAALLDETKAISILPNDYTCYLERGRIYVEMNRLPEAHADFTKVISLNPNDANAYVERAKLLASTGRNTYALADINKALSINPQMPEMVKLKESISKPSGKSQTVPAKPAVKQRANSNTINSATESLPDEARVYFTHEHFGMTVDAQINGRPIKMTFDTGAPSNIIGKNQLEQLGITPPSGEPAGKTGGSSNLSTTKFWQTTADIKVGTIMRKNVPLDVLETCETPPLLGQEFFKDFTYTIDKGAQSISFVKRGKAVAAVKDNYSVPFRFLDAGNRIVVKAEVEGHPCDMIFDTGNSAAAVSFTGEEFKKLGMSIPQDASLSSSIGITGSGSCYKFPVSRITLGPIDQRDITIQVSPGGGMEMPLLGQPFWADWQYSIDMDNKVIRFVRR